MLLTLAGIMIAASPVHAQQKLLGFGFFEENDTFTSSDSSYTQGLRLNLSLRLPEWLADLGLFPCDNMIPPTLGACGVFTFAFGQSIYTPDSINVRERRPRGHPYAGFLYVAPGIQLLRQYSIAGGVQDASLATELLVGVTGPWSQAEEAQSLFHWGLAHGALRPKGWDHQLRNAVIINPRVAARMRIFQACVMNEALSIKCNSTFAHRLLDVIPVAEAAVGNMQTYAGAGLVGRFGWNVPNDFGPSLIPVAAGVGPPDSAQAPSILDRISVGIHGGVNARRYAFNRLVEGGSQDEDGFRSWTMIDRRSNLTELAAGGFLGAGSYVFTLQYVWRGREFDVRGEPRNNKRLRFANLTITRAF